MERSQRHTARRVIPVRCTGQCGFNGRLAAHHDRLLALDTAVEPLLDLLEIAVTWRELDYSDTDVIPPSMWLEFASRHAWHEPDQAMRAFALATDVAMRAGNTCETRTTTTFLIECGEPAATSA